MSKKELFQGGVNGYQHQQLKRNQDFKKDQQWLLDLAKIITDEVENTFWKGKLQDKKSANKC